MSSDIPRFAVVGHPNKGKSSLVATLARDEFVAIGQTPGTTREAMVYPLRVNGETLYELIDTPGFQQPRLVLEWLQAHDSGTATRPNLIKTFLEIEENQRNFPDECRLLKPIVEGAAIVYVVDGSHPFSEEYEIELEILRWTSSPRLGLINPIASGAFVDEWQTALSQFCSTVRVFNPVAADFEKCLELLEVCSTLNQDWKKSLDAAIEALRKDRVHAFDSSVVAIIDVLVSSLSLVVEQAVSSKLSSVEQFELMKEDFSNRLKVYEDRARGQVERSYHYRKLSRIEEPLELLEEVELFSEEAWRVFGLSRRALTKLSMIAGLSAGATVDALLGGSSFALGAFMGGVLGAGSAWMFGEKLVESSVGFFRFGRRTLKVGPIQSLQFAFVLLNRARLHHSLVERRSHADRSELSLQSLTQERLSKISEAETRVLSSVFRAIRQQKFDDKKRENLRGVIKRLLSLE